ncbi:hypothetical protein [Halalkalirubrum salinum]|uniref:hypothetical protein n=1 Tax=Halalkalirubrum salinum TaxID=2563889 RepID=UPI0010FB0EAB|nr:hypothetical protein [Halalkalirubrum salinum]
MESATQLESNATTNNHVDSPVDELVSRSIGAIRFASFWLAVALPFVYMPLLVIDMTPLTAMAFFGLFCANIIALIVGHGHNNR